MKPRTKNSLAFVVLCALPFEVSLTPEDSTETRIQFLGGAGQYALISRGCSGEILTKSEMPFSEFGAAFEHKFISPVRLGIRGSYIIDENRVRWEQHYDPPRGTEIVTINPFANIESKYFALGGGYFWANHPLTGRNDGLIDSPISGYLRLGNRRSVYFSSSFLHGIPLYSSGYFQLGLGSGKYPNIDWWLGPGLLGPYDGMGVLAKANIRIHRSLYLNLLARIGQSEGVSENAASLGLTYQLENGK